MNRLSLPVWLVLVITAGFCMFQIKFAVQELEHQLGQTNRDIQRAQEQVRVLKAEWSYLNEPGRLSDLNRRHLGLAPVAAKQMENLAALPQRLDVALPSPQFQPKPSSGETATLASGLEWSASVADLDAATPSMPAFASLAPSEFVPVSFEPDQPLAEGHDVVRVAAKPVAAKPAAHVDPTSGSEDLSAEAAAATRAATGPLVSPTDDPLGALIAATAAEEQQ
jgi:cell division protein FtsL